MSAAKSITPFLELIFAAEQRGIAPFLENKFGYNALQIDRFGVVNLLADSAVANKFYYGKTLPANDYTGIVIGDFKGLPIQSSTLDLVVVSHVLEMLKNGQHLHFLEDVYRTLIPEGNLIIIGFNPFSYAGLAHLFKLDSKNIRKHVDFVPIFRLKKWLAETGFTFVDYKTFFFRLPIANKNTLEKLEFMESMGQVLVPYTGAFYILHACKRVVNLTPVKNVIVRKHSPVIHPSV
jgi:SAM-dependent methyltransferase